jgi:hypothetical protein
MPKFNTDQLQIATSITGSNSGVPNAQAVIDAINALVPTLVAQTVQATPSLQGVPGKDGQQGIPGKDGAQGTPGYTPVKGVDYFDGTQGLRGATGTSGPNQVTTSTITNITGMLKGNGSLVTAATAPTDYVATGDSRLSDARTPTAHNQTKSTITDFAHTHPESDVTNLATDLAAKAPLASPSFTTPNIGVSVGTSLAATGAITSSGAGIGYASGAGGTVTQGSSRTTGVTLSKLCGTIVMYSAAVAAAASSTFTLTNTFIAATDMVIVQHVGATNACSWHCEAIPAAGSASIVVKNISAASITEATPLRFTIIKGVTA